MEKLISIIVPVYNTEEHLERAIVSILNQTYSRLELILVDDGSTDNSLDMCQQYEKKDDRIKVISQQNAGVSVARNTGINASNGELLLFVDSDDFVEENMLETLMSYYTGPDELLIYGYQIHDLNNDHKLSFNSGNKSLKEMSVSDLAADFWTYYESGLTNSPCNKLYTASIIKENQIEFPTGVRMGEDIAFNLRYVENISHIKLLDKYLYHYILYPSQSTRQVNLTIANDMIFFLAKIEKFIEKHKGFEANKKNKQNHNQQLYRHLLTALRMPYQTQQTTGKERFNYVRETSEKFHTSFTIDWDFPTGIFDKIIVDSVRRRKYNRIHQLFTLTESAKNTLKKIKK